MTQFQIKVTHPDERTFTGKENENILDASIRQTVRLKLAVKEADVDYARLKSLTVK